MAAGAGQPTEEGFSTSTLMGVVLALMSLATTLSVIGSLISVLPGEVALATAGATTAVASACRIARHRS